MACLFLWYLHWIRLVWYFYFWTLDCQYWTGVNPALYDTFISERSIVNTELSEPSLVWHFYFWIIILSVRFAMSALFANYSGILNALWHFAGTSICILFAAVAALLSYYIIASPFIMHKRHIKCHQAFVTACGLCGKASLKVIGSNWNYVFNRL